MPAYASIDPDHLPGDIARFLACQKHNCRGDLFGTANSAQRRLIHDTLHGCRWQICSHIGLDEARRHGVHGDPPRGVFPSE